MAAPLTRAAASEPDEVSYDEVWMAEYLYGLAQEQYEVRRTASARHHVAGSPSAQVTLRPAYIGMTFKQAALQFYTDNNCNAVRARCANAGAVSPRDARALWQILFALAHEERGKKVLEFRCTDDVYVEEHHTGMAIAVDQTTFAPCVRPWPARQQRP